jgi:diacylglycerol kinase family enzyme
LERTFTAVGRRIEVDTVPRRNVYADGERVSRTPAVFEILPQALTVVYTAPAGPDTAV